MTTDNTEDMEEKDFKTGIKFHPKKGLRIREMTMRLKPHRDATFFNRTTPDFRMTLWIPGIHKKHEEGLVFDNENKGIFFSDFCAAIWEACTGQKPTTGAASVTKVESKFPLILTEDTEGEDLIKDFKDPLTMTKSEPPVAK